MRNTPLGPTVPPSDTNDNPNPSDTPDVPAGPRDKQPTIPLVDAVVVRHKHGNGNGGNGDDDGGNGDDDNGNRDDECAQHLEELVQRLGDLDALAYCAQFLLGEIPRDPSPSAEAPMRRLWRLVERIASETNDALGFANAAVAFVRGSHRKRGGNDDGTGSGGGQS